MNPEEVHSHYSRPRRGGKGGCGQVLLIVLAFVIFAFTLSAFERCGG